MSEELLPSADAFIDYFGKMAADMQGAKDLLAQAERERTEIESRQAQLAALAQEAVRVENDLNALRVTYHEKQNEWIRYEKQINELRLDLSRKYEAKRAAFDALHTQIEERKVELNALTDQQVQEAQDRIAKETDLAQRALESLRASIVEHKEDVRILRDRLRKVVGTLDGICGD